MTKEDLIQSKIARYGSRGDIGQSIKLFLAVASINHTKVGEHSKRVALLAEQTAELLDLDTSAAFLGGIFHDVGKLALPGDLFTENVNITQEQYALIKTHSESGFQMPRDLHPFSALCAGLHHAIYKNGYGINVTDIPSFFGPHTIEKALKVITVISVCDFIDAASYRETKIIDGTTGNSLRDMLERKYPDHHEIISTALIAKELQE